MAEEQQEWAADDVVFISRDVMEEDAFIFRQGDQVKIVRVASHPDMPDYRYVILSGHNNREYTLSADYLSKDAPRPASPGLQPPAGPGVPGQQYPGFPAREKGSRGFWVEIFSFERFFAPTIIKVLWWIFLVISAVSYLVVSGIIISDDVGIGILYLLVIGPIVLALSILFYRVLFELIIAILQIRNHVKSIDGKLD